jgi:hypothetical protein
MKKIFGSRCSASHSDNLKSKTCSEPSRSIQNLKWLGLSLFAFVLVVAGSVAEAQQPKKVPRIGYLSALDPATESARSETIRPLCAILATRSQACRSAGRATDEVRAGDQSQDGETDWPGDSVITTLPSGQCHSVKNTQTVKAGSLTRRVRCMIVV